MAGLEDAVQNIVLEAKNLTKSYRVPGGVVRAVRGISVELKKGRTLAIVGESGCGKSTLARLLVGLEHPDSGTATKSSLIPMVFQDSLGSLHPRRRVRQLMVEPLLIRDRQIRMTPEKNARAEELARQVGLPVEYLDSFAHELSGGQRQRVNIARALSLEPAVILLDEPVSALDVSIQAQILNLLVDLQNQKSLAIVFISHDLSVVRHLAHEVQVLYLGQVVEQGPVEQVLREPRHPYTVALLASDPALPAGPVTAIGEPPSPLEVSSGCAYAKRCPQAEAICSQQSPTLEEITTQSATQTTTRAFETRTVACFVVQRSRRDHHANASAPS